MLQWWADTVNLFFPRLCPACGNALMPTDEEICLHCLFRLPYTNFHHLPDNPMARNLWGRVPVEGACAYLFFKQGSRVQRLIHQFKYRNRQQIGCVLGRLYGAELQKVSPYRSIDLIVPVPLHRGKQRKRGYNQSERFAEGLSRTLGVPVVTDVLFRTLPSTSQTRLSQEARWDNVRDIFSVKEPGRLEGKHVLLVDDVFTTGATIESCATTLLDNARVQISVATIVFAG